MKYYLAIDIGASSGRHIIGIIENEKIINTECIYRFPNGVKEENGHLIWDIDSIFSNILEGIKQAYFKYKNIESISIDTWGVDYVLLNDDQIIKPVYAYRDSRTKDVIDQVHTLIPRNELYRITGCQYQEFNTIYQLYWDKVNNRLDKATDYLMIPEYLIYLLTGKKVHEYTNASTTSLLDLETNDYSETIINCLNLKKTLFKNITKPGAIIGNIQKSILEKMGLKADITIPVSLCATHDTGSAVEAIELEDGDCYISSGTWSLLGIKLNKGINNVDAYKANYSNEYGPNYIRFQKNIMGMWITQNLVKELKCDVTELIELAKKSNYKEIFDCNDNVFLSPSNMKEEIVKWLKDNNKQLPKSDADIVNSTYHSLAYSYKQAIEELERITNKTIKRIIIVGGGAKNKYLNELTSKYTKKKVLALPIEATSIGNLMVQMKTIGGNNE